MKRLLIVLFLLSMIFSISFAQTNDLPESIVLLTPSDDATGVSRTPVLTWEHPDDASISEILLFISTDDEDMGVGIDVTSADGAYTVTDVLEFNTVYFWQVIPFNNEGEPEDNLLWSFRTVNVPFGTTSTGLVYSPTNVNTNAQQQITIQNNWSVQTQATVTFEGLESDEFSLPMPLANGRVSMNANGSANLFVRFTPRAAKSYDAFIVFTHYTEEDEPYVLKVPLSGTGVTPPPPPPSAAHTPDPAHTATNVPIDVTLEWVLQPTAMGNTFDTLHIFVSDDINDMGDGISLATHILSYAPEFELEYETTYYWKVVPANQGVLPSTVEVWSFTTAPPPPPFNVSVWGTPFENGETVNFGNTVLTGTSRTLSVLHDFDEEDPHSVTVSFVVEGDDAFGVGNIHFLTGEFTPITELTTSGGFSLTSIRFMPTAEIEYTGKITITLESINRDEPYVFEINLSGTGHVPPPPPPHSTHSPNPEDEAVDVAIDTSFSWTLPTVGGFLGSEPFDSLTFYLTTDIEDFGVGIELDITATSYTPTAELLPGEEYFWKVIPRNGPTPPEFPLIWSFITETITEPPVFTVTFAEPDFGDVLVGENHFAPFSITNTSNEPISVYLEFENDYDGVFNIFAFGGLLPPHNNPIPSIPAGFTLNFDILFIPAEVQSYNTNFILTHIVGAAAGEFFIEIPISGAGYTATTPPPFNVSVWGTPFENGETVNFGNTVLTGTSRTLSVLHDFDEEDPHSVTVSFVVEGDDAFGVGNIHFLTGEFTPITELTTSGGFSLTSIRFMPTAEIVYTGKITITLESINRDEPYVFEINLSGTGHVPPPPAPLATHSPDPEDEAIDVALDTTFSWTLPAVGGFMGAPPFDTLTFYLTTDEEDFGDGIALDITDTSYTPDMDLLPDTEYFWRVIPRNGPTPPEFPSTWSFTTEDIIETPIFTVVFAEPDFGNKMVGENHFAPFSITNTSEEPVSVYLEFENDYAGVFNLLAFGGFLPPNLNPLNIPTGLTLSLDVVFMPDAVQNYDTTLILTHYIDGVAADFSIEIPITASGVEEAETPFTVTPSGLADFGSSILRIASAPLTFTITNISNADIEIDSIEITTTDEQFRFVTDPDLDSPIAPDGTLTFNMIFVPAGLNERTGTLTITDTEGNSEIIELTGFGLPIPAPNPLTLIGPENGATNVSILATLRWNAPSDPNVTSVRIFISDMADDMGTGTELASVWTTTFTPSPELQFGKTYFWSVIPYTSAGPAVDNQKWSFTTIPNTTMFETNVSEIAFGEREIGVNHSSGLIIQNLHRATAVINISITDNPDGVFAIQNALPPAINGNMTIAALGHASQSSTGMVNIRFTPTESKHYNANLVLQHVPAGGGGDPFTIIIPLSGHVVGGPTPPEPASNPVPEHLAEDVPVDIIFEWEIRQPYLGNVYDSFKFYITEDVNNFGEGINLDLHIQSYIPPTPLKQLTTYYWKVVNTNQGVEPEVVEIWEFTTGIVPEPIFTITPDDDEFDFGSSILTLTTDPISFTIKNEGNGNLNLTHLEIIGGEDQFRFVGLVNITEPILPDETFTFSITFTPDELGEQTASLYIAGNFEGHHSADLIGFGLPIPAPIFVITPDDLEIDFGSTIINIATEPKAFTITNEGDAVLTLYEIEVNNEQFNLGFVERFFPVILPGESISFEVVFTPTQLGEQNAVMTISGDFGANHVVAFTGIGLPVPAPIFTITPEETEFDFGDVYVFETGTAVEFTITNDGNADLIIDNILLSDERFVFVNSENYNFPETIAPAGTLTFAVNFAPIVIGLQEAVMTISGNFGDDYTADFKGTGKAVNVNDPTLELVTVLKGNYPNPFNPETTIRFSTATPGPVSIEIYNARGQRVRELVNTFMEEGNHTVIWNGRDENNRELSSGMYFYRMTTSDYSSVQRMILMK